MDFILDIPLELRLVLLFLLGTIIGGQINHGIYRLAVFARPISPWSQPHDEARERCWFDRLPIVGWIGLRREQPLHGRGFWIRPLLIELLSGVGFAWLYCWEIHGGLLPDGVDLERYQSMLHVQYLQHVILISLMTVATFIDFDEQTIPDGVTIPGTLIALCLAAVPMSRPPVMTHVDLGGNKTVEPLMVALPESEATALACAVACLVAWCIALLPKLWYTKHGFRKAVRYFVAHMLRPRRKRKRPEGARPRRPFALVIVTLALLVVGPVAIIVFWQIAEPQSRTSLFSSLVGMAFGGGLVWAVRILGTVALQKEAMGFGDVTLMAMIGAFLGWQAALIVFFLAPFAALLIAVAQFIIVRRSDIAFGPYLCVATLFLILGWPTIWNRRAADTFGMGWLIPGMVAVCLVLMGIMLFAWRVVKDALLRGRE